MCVQSTHITALSVTETNRLKWTVGHSHNVTKTASERCFGKVQESSVSIRLFLLIKRDPTPAYRTASRYVVLLPVACVSHTTPERVWQPQGTHTILWIFSVWYPPSIAWSSVCFPALFEYITLGTKIRDDLISDAWAVTMGEYVSKVEGLWCDGMYWGTLDKVQRTARSLVYF